MGIVFRRSAARLEYVCLRPTTDFSYGVLQNFPILALYVLFLRVEYRADWGWGSAVVKSSAYCFAEFPLQDVSALEVRPNCLQLIGVDPYEISCLATEFVVK